MNSFQIKIPRRSSHCYQHGGSFAVPSEVYSLISQTFDQEIVRRDYCSACWSTIQMKREKQHSIYWKSQLEKKSSDEIASRRLDKGLKILLEMVENEESSQAELFVLALFLAHARLLLFRQEMKKDGRIYYLYEIQRQDEMIAIPFVSIKDEEIHSLQQSIALKLSN